LSGNVYRLTDIASIRLGIAAGDSSRLEVRSGSLVGTYISLAQGEGTSATLTVKGGGLVRALEDLDVGDFDRGTLVIDSGGRVEVVSHTYVGNRVESSGSVVLTGEGASLTTGDASHVMFIGGAGTGSVTVLAGADVISGSVSIAGGGGNGSVLMDGRNTTWTAIGMSVGSEIGTGSVTVADGAHLDAGSGTVRINAAGTLTLNGGRVSCTFFVADGAFNFNSGIVEFKGTSGLDVGTVFLPNKAPFGKLLELTAGKTVLSEGQTTVHPDGLVVLSGGALGSAKLLNEGEVVLNSPASAIDVADIDNRALLRGEGRAAGVLTNAATGEVRAQGDQRILFTHAGAAPHTNAGRFNLFGGTLEFRSSGGVANAATGHVQGQGQIITAGNGLSNLGRITFSGGASNVFGQVTNLTPVSASPSKILVTGGGTATFYNDVKLQAGSTFQVSDNSHAVFLADVTAAAGTFTGPGTKYFEGTASVASLASPGASVVQETGTLAAGFIREESLTVRGHAGLTPKARGGQTSVLGSLEIQGEPGNWTGTLDLADNALILDYSTDSPAATVRSQLLSGRAGGDWNGTGITSSAAGRFPVTAIGYAEASQLLGPRGGEFEGQRADDTALLLRHTRLGDASLDGDVAFEDLVALAQNYNQNAGAKLWSEGDFTYDGNVNFADLVALAQNYGTALSSAAIPGAPVEFGRDLAAAFASVPEPHLFPAVPTLLGLVKRRRRATARR
jgi:T5SS/PEP-CTERM-associated repeat protein